MDFSNLAGGLPDIASWLTTITFEDVFFNKWARAAGMVALVLLTIWVIALVYNGYAQDSVISPVGLKAHTNRRLGEGTIVFDQARYPFAMDGVEATCRVYYQYEDRDGRTRRFPVTERTSLKLHIRVSAMTADANTHFGFENGGAVGELPQGAVWYPPIDVTTPPETIEPTPATVAEYIEANGLVAKWTEDDDAPIVSIGPTLLELLSEERKSLILQRAKTWIETQTPGIFNNMRRANATKERANAFGSYYLKLQFSKRPDFVLFQHPNKELKMTAWLTVLTSLFSIAMDLWPVEQSNGTNRARSPGSIERPIVPPSSTR